MLYNLDEICLIPTLVSDVESRSEVNVYTNRNRYPLFTAPMSCLVDETNYKEFEKNRINTIIPRTVKWETRLGLLKEGQWVSVGFKEAQYICEELIYCEKIRVCIDQANGHMSRLLDLCKTLKERYGNRIRIMTGNIANPYTYREYARAGVDYVRVGIGGGGACFPAGTMITTPFGYKDIKDIKVGDKVKTIDGEHNVINTFVKHTNTIININDDVKCTPDHKFFVIRKDDKDKVNENNVKDYGFYVEAKNLTSDYLLVQV